MKLTQTSKVSILFGHGNFEGSEIAHDDLIVETDVLPLDEENF